MARIDNSLVHLHHLIFGFPKEPNTVVDHINQDILDSRVANLRLVTKGENTFNKKPKSDNKYGKTGVYYDNNNVKKPWYARISKDKTIYNIGKFETFMEAVEAREQAEMDLYGYKTKRDNIDRDYAGIKSNKTRKMSASANRSVHEKSRKRGSKRSTSRWGK